MFNIAFIRLTANIFHVTITREVKRMNNIKILREQHKMTQQECANIFGVKLRAWQTYEQGVSEPKFDTLFKIADYFNVSLDYLLGREQQADIFAQLNLNTKVNDEKFIELYSALPDEVKKIFVDTMSKLSNAAIDCKNSIRKSKTYTCGELKDIKKG